MLFRMYNMSKTSCTAGFWLRLLYEQGPSRIVLASRLALQLTSQQSGQRPVNYCHRRYFLTSERLTSKKRYLYTSVALQEKEQTKHQMKDDMPEEKSLLKNKDRFSGKAAAVEKPASDLTTTERLKPPRPVIDDKESSLPNHDPGRITEEQRRLERKADSMFQELIETRGASKDTFMFAVKKFVDRENVYWRGAVEFIYAGMKEMDHFGVHKDLDAYKALIQAFPEEKMIPRNAWQVEFMHYPRHQQCGIDLLEQMEHNGVIPDDAFGVLLKNRFGREAHVTRKFRRMLYWLPKFKNINPYPIPMELPLDPRELALIALRRMSVDQETHFKVFETVDVEEEPEEDTFIASAQSPTQQRLINQHKTEEPLFVEGPYPVYLRDIRQNYFLLRAEPNIHALMKKKQQEKADEDDENLFEWKNFFEEEQSSELRPILSVHEQDDSTILALCITGTGTKSSVMSWVRCLEMTNPQLARTPILFKILTSPDSGQLDVIGDSRPFKALENTSRVPDK